MCKGEKQGPYCRFTRNDAQVLERAILFLRTRGINVDQIALVRVR